MRGEQNWGWTSETLYPSLASVILGFGLNLKKREKNEKKTLN